MKEGRSSRWKRLLSLVMACVMTLTLCLPATASAKETKPAKKEITEVELAIGDVSRLEVLGWYEKTIWSTDNEAVAPVTEDGTVTAAAEGTAVVSAESHLFRGRLKVRTNFTVTVGPDVRASASLRARRPSSPKREESSGPAQIRRRQRWPRTALSPVSGRVKPL